MFFNMNLKIKRVWVEVISTHGGFGTLAEFNLMQKNDKLKAGTYEEFKVATPQIQYMKSTARE